MPAETRGPTFFGPHLFLLQKRSEQGIELGASAMQRYKKEYLSDKQHSTGCHKRSRREEV